MEHTAEAFYGEAPPEVARRAASRLNVESLAPMGTPVAQSADGIDQVRRGYVECLRDKAIPVAVQRMMYGTAGIGTVYTVDTDTPHSCPGRRSSPGSWSGSWRPGHAEPRTAGRLRPGPAGRRPPPSAQSRAAVDREQLPVDPLAVRGEQEGDRGGDVLGAAEARRTQHR